MAQALVPTAPRERAFPKNAKVKLGPNGEHSKDRRERPDGWIYMTIVKPATARAAPSDRRPHHVDKQRDRRYQQGDDP